MGNAYALIHVDVFYDQALKLEKINPALRKFTESEGFWFSSFAVEYTSDVDILAQIYLGEGPTKLIIVFGRTELFEETFKHFAGNIPTIFVFTTPPCPNYPNGDIPDYIKDEYFEAVGFNGLNSETLYQLAMSLLSKAH